MKTYIWNQQRNYYIEFPEEIDTLYWEGLIGTTYEDFLDGKWVLLSDEQVQFHEDNPSATVQEVMLMQLTSETLGYAKNLKLIALTDRDYSTEVNGFVVRKEGEEDIIDWLTPDLRANYRSSIEAAELLGVENLSLYVGGKEFELPTQTAKLMLARILLYADQCFMVTKRHIAGIDACETIEEVDNYDYTTGYPERIVFTL